MSEQVSLKVYGMTCALCSSSIEDNLKKLDGVDLASVSYATEKAVLTFDSAKIQLLQIKSSIEKLGFTVEDSAGKVNNKGLSKSTFYSLRAGKATMDLQVILGTTAAYLYSIYVALIRSSRQRQWRSVRFRCCSIR